MKAVLIKEAVNMLFKPYLLAEGRKRRLCDEDLAREKRKAIEHIKGEISENAYTPKTGLLKKCIKTHLTACRNAAPVKDDGGNYR